MYHDCERAARGSPSNRVSRRAASAGVCAPNRQAGAVHAVRRVGIHTQSPTRPAAACHYVYTDPFDKHRISFVAYIPNADILNCSDVLSAASVVHLVPASAEWSMVGAPLVEHPYGADGLLRRDRCAVSYTVRRNVAVLRREANGHKCARRL
eukprot:128701-Prymnesium_polylepis.1